MPAVVVDTDVVSFAFKRDSRARPFRGHLLGVELFISFMTLAELERWTVARRWGAARRQKLERYLRRFAIVHTDPTLCRWWAEVKTATDRRGQPLDTADAWIAATARALDVPLVTNNPADYAGVEGLTVLSEATG